MDMRTHFQFKIDEDVSECRVDSWQQAVEEFMSAMQQNGFTIDEKRKRQIVELAKFGRVTV